MRDIILVVLSLALVFSGVFAQNVQSLQKFGELEVDNSTQAGRKIAEIMTRQREKTQTKNRTRNTHGYMVSNYVHSLINASKMMGGIGPRVSELARNVNESSQRLMNYEEKLRNRNIIIKFFFGADQGVVNATEQELEITWSRIKELESLEMQVGDEQLKAMFQEQLRLMNLEMAQVQIKLVNEKKARGLIGFLLGT